MALALDPCNALACHVAAINITPLVDVLLVLLVIFMVTAPVLARSLDVQLPQYRPDTPSRPAIALARGCGRRLLAGGAAVDRNALDAALRAAVARDADLQLVLRSDDDGDYQGFVAALSAARAAGVHAIATTR